MGFITGFITGIVVLRIFQVLSKQSNGKIINKDNK